jgi:glycerol dehydrogenase-like iron-containing ADH family enzyme
MGELFHTVYGRGLVGELPAIAHRPYLVVTMEDLWPAFEPVLSDGRGGVHLVETLRRDRLDAIAQELPPYASVIGLGGGRALDVAKYLVWRRPAPLFLAPTSTSVNAAFAQRAAVREEGIVRYVGWAVPEAVYVDFDVIARAPADLNRSGVGDIFCYHTAHWDWAMANERGRTEPRWPYRQEQVDEARAVLDRVLAAVDEIHAVSDEGIRTLMEGHRWGGAAFDNNGWNPCPIEGAEHFVFYSLENVTGKAFIHGQAVCLGLLLMSALQDNDPEDIRTAVDRVGVRYRPEDMGVTWDDVTQALRQLPEYVERAGLWYTVASDRPITEDFIDRMREWLSS